MSCRQRCVASQRASRNADERSFEESWMASELKIIPAGPEHTSLLLEFIHELAAYEKLSDQVSVTDDALRASLFGPSRAAEAVLAYWREQPAGFALFFHNFSTFLGQRGLYLEDLFVRPAMRGRGIGLALMRHIAKLAVQRHCGRFEWAVLDWNRPAIDFYESLGTAAMSDWTVYRLSGDALQRLAEGSTGDL